VVSRTGSLGGRSLGGAVQLNSRLLRQKTMRLVELLITAVDKDRGSLVRYRGGLEVKGGEGAGQLVIVEFRDKYEGKWQFSQMQGSRSGLQSTVIGGRKVAQMTSPTPRTKPPSKV
jgi:hypothetical protein